MGLHGHVHRADNQLFRYDITPGGRRLDLIAAGTFGAPVQAWTPGYPLQYNLLALTGRTLTVETRCREALNGAWRPDARWLQGPGRLLVATEDGRLQVRDVDAPPAGVVWEQDLSGFRPRRGPAPAWARRW